MSDRCREVPIERRETYVNNDDDDEYDGDDGDDDGNGNGGDDDDDDDDYFLLILNKKKPITPSCGIDTSTNVPHLILYKTSTALTCWEFNCTNVLRANIELPS